MIKESFVWRDTMPQLSLNEKSACSWKTNNVRMFLGSLLAVHGLQVFGHGTWQEGKKKERITLGDRPSISQFDHNTVD